MPKAFPLSPFGTMEAIYAFTFGGIRLTGDRQFADDFNRILPSRCLRPQATGAAGNLQMVLRREPGG